MNRAQHGSPVVDLLGPQQCGKTTLARGLGAGHFFDLESTAAQRQLANAEYALGKLTGLVVLDEIQERPDLFKLLRVLADREKNPARFLILGSASPQLIREASESLAGRVEFVDLQGFDVSETGGEMRERLWVRGGFPGSFLARSEADSQAWREGFIRTFLERDLPRLGLRIPAPALRRFWAMLAHDHGQTWNGSELGRSLGLTDKTVRHYLDILTQSYLVRQLMPWHENLGKRQVKAPKVYFRDSGLLHSLLEIPERRHLMAHPKVGASWEGFALETIARLLPVNNFYFWSTHSGAELDLFFEHKGRRHGVEIKFSDAPQVTKSMRSAQADLRLDQLWVVNLGEKAIEVEKGIAFCSLEGFLERW